MGERVEGSLMGALANETNYIKADPNFLNSLQTLGRGGVRKFGIQAFSARTIGERRKL